jgi:putative PIN family toxin of toxin-antitoxin system
MTTFIMDTCVLVSALKSNKGASHLFLKYFMQDKIELALSLPVFREYWEVTEREHLKIDSEARIGVLKSLTKFSIPTEIHFKWRPFLVDEADNMILELAVAANANIVTHNIKDFVGVENKFNIKVYRPQEVI